MAKIAMIKTALQDSNLPITVDIVEWCLIADDFKKKIELESIPIF